MEPGSDFTQVLQKSSKFLDYALSAAIYFVVLLVFLFVVWTIIHYLKMRRKVKQRPRSIQDVATDSLSAIKRLRSQANKLISNRQASLDPDTAAKLKGILDQGQSIVKEMQRCLASLQQRVADKESNLPDTLVNRFSDSTNFVAQTYLEIKIAIESLPGRRK